MIVAAGGFRLVASPIRIAGYDPSYGPPPRLGEHGSTQPTNAPGYS
jgi:hypothetical protein